MIADNERIIIFGCGGHSRSVVDVLLASTPGVELVFVDESAKDGELLYGFPVLKDYPIDNEPFFLAIGDNLAREQQMAKVANTGRLISVISPSAHLGRSSTVAAGCFVANFCHIGPEARIGTNTILNTAAIIEHEVQIGAYCHIGPNATVSGRCQLGDHVFVGVGATVKDYVSICSKVVIGAGATVVDDITEPGTYIGTPARRLAK